MDNLQDPPVEERECWELGNCENCLENMTPACPKFTCQDCDDSHSCAGCPNNPEIKGG